jgi:hypothetical protein
MVFWVLKFHKGASMKIKNGYIVSLLYTSLCYGAQAPKTSQEPFIPKQIDFFAKIETPNPSIFHVKVDIPAATRIAEAAERSSQTLKALPNELGKAALITIGAVSSLILIYQGIKRLEKEKKDWLGFSFIGSGIAGFVALCFLTTTKWFTSPV